MAFEPLVIATQKCRIVNRREHETTALKRKNEHHERTDYQCEGPDRRVACFSGRIVTVAGLFTPDNLHAIAECAEKFGNGKAIFTSGLAAEIVGIPFERIPEVEEFMAKRNLRFGGTGTKVRPLTSCKGTTCVYGNIDTQALAKVLFDRFYIGMGDVKLPHKFKINSRSVWADVPTVV